MEFNETDIDGTIGEHHMTQSDRGDKSSEDLHNMQADRHDDGVFSSSPVDPAADDAGLFGFLISRSECLVWNGMRSIQNKLKGSLLVADHK